MKTLRIFLLILIIIGLGLIYTQSLWVPKLVNQILSSETKQSQILATQNPAPTSVSITTQKIKEENFSGDVAVVSGTSPLAVKMQEYIAGTVNQFRKEANADVPSMREKFGADSPPATYTIDINAKYIKNKNTDSIVTDVYSYTGGAHGATIYKVMTAGISLGKILSLTDVVKQDKQNDFTALVKKELNSWVPEGSDATVVFADSVKDLTFDSFANWSLDEQNLNIYFDQYAIGPGVLGATVFPIPFSKIKDFINPNFSR